MTKWNAHPTNDEWNESNTRMESHPNQSMINQSINQQIKWKEKWKKKKKKKKKKNML